MESWRRSMERGGRNNGGPPDPTGVFQPFACGCRHLGGSPRPSFVGFLRGLRAAGWTEVSPVEPYTPEDSQVASGALFLSPRLAVASLLPPGLRRGSPCPRTV